MNAARRKQLNEIAGKLADLQNELDSIKDAEQDAFDAMPEGFQGSERGEKSEAAIDAMNDASSSIESAIDEINNASE